MKKYFFSLFLISLLIGSAFAYPQSNTNNISVIREAKVYYRENSMQSEKSAIDEMTKGSDQLVQADTYIEGNRDSDIYLFCYSNVTNNGNSHSYKLGFISNNQDYDYCTMESLRGTLSKQKLFNNEMTDYFIETSSNNAIIENYIDIIGIQYYNSDNKLIATQRKGIYPDGELGSLSTMDY